MLLTAGISRPDVSAICLRQHSANTHVRCHTCIPNRSQGARHICRAQQSLDYKQAGVDIDAGAELVRRIQKLNPSIGGFSGLVPFGKQYFSHS